MHGALQVSAVSHTWALPLSPNSLLHPSSTCPTPPPHSQHSVSVMQLNPAAPKQWHVCVLGPWTPLWRLDLEFSLEPRPLLSCFLTFHWGLRLPQWSTAHLPTWACLHSPGKGWAGQPVLLCLEAEAARDIQSPAGALGDGGCAHLLLCMASSSASSACLSALSQNLSGAAGLQPHPQALHFAVH